MAYMNQEKKAIIKAALTPILKKYKIKSSLSIRHHSTICLNIKSSPCDFLLNYYTEKSRNNNSDIQKRNNLSVNSYWFQDQFTGNAKEILTELFTALKSAGYYNNSDSQSDYFDVAYYYEINLGDWDKPYIVG